MIPWIQVYSNLVSHRKTGKLADALGLANSFVSPDVVAVGILISLWTWAIQNASNGDLSGCSARNIAEACRWKKKPEVLITALKEADWIDEDGKLHDWEEYASLLLEQEENRKEKTRERVQRYREQKKKKTESQIDLACNRYVTVTDTPCNAPTIPDITIPNITVPNNSSISLSEEKKEEKKENRVEQFGSAQMWVDILRDAQEKNLPHIAEIAISRARDYGFVINPETLEVTQADE